MANDAAEGDESTVVSSGFAVAASDGSPLFYENLGRKDARDPIVLCDGIGCDGFVWKHLAGDLGDDHRLIHWHYRGHGRSPRPRDPSRISVEDFADDLAAVLRENHLSSAILMGHSMGVQVVLETYRRHPELVRALVLVCGASGHPLRTFRNTERFEALLPSVRKAVERAPKFFNTLSRVLVPTRFAWNIATKLEIDPELVNPLDFMPYLRGLSRVEVDYFIQVLDRASKHSADDILARVDVPTLIIAGELDSFTPAHRSQQMAASIPQARLRTIERGTHSAPIEHPQQVYAAIREFLADVVCR